MTTYGTDSLYTGASIPLNSVPLRLNYNVTEGELLPYALMSLEYVQVKTGRLEIGQMKGSPCSEKVTKKLHLVYLEKLRLSGY